MVPALYTYTTIALQYCSTAKDSSKNANVNFPHALFIMTVPLLQLRQCLLRTSRNRTLLHRTFHTSSPRAIVRPFLLSDIGEGEHPLFLLDLLSLNRLRHQGSSDHTMVRGARGTRRAVRQDLRGPV